MNTVALRTDGTWRFAGFQNSRATYMGRPEEAERLTAELRQELRREH